ncbi:MAG: DUF2125 domain-containing protein [Pseudolabrys sp.]
MVPDTDSIQPRRRTGRRVTIILLIVFVLVAGWAWLWKFAASRAETAVAGWRAREARAGRVYSCGTQSVGGFPFRIELTCGKASALLRSKATPLVEIRTPSVLVGADLYQPDTLTSRFVGPLTVGAPGKPPGIWVNWTFAQSTVHGTPSAPERVTLEFERPTVDRIVGGKHQSLLSARRIALEGRIASGSPSDHPVIEVSLKAVRASAPGLHPAAAPPINMPLAARLTGLADFAPKPWAERFREMQAAGGRIEITHARIKQGNTLAVGKGSLSIDANGQLAGQSARRWRSRPTWTSSPACSTGCRRAWATSRASRPVPISASAYRCWASRPPSTAAAPSRCRCALPTAWPISGPSRSGRRRRCSERAGATSASPA